MKDPQEEACTNGVEHAGTYCSNEEQGTCIVGKGG